MTQKEIQKILDDHKLWLNGQGGLRANLSYANLSYANLRFANLRYADLRSADLRYANLRYADLRYADLSYADLRSANLSYANLSYANLRYADLRYANLSYANLSYADLSYANLSYANLRYADLRYANLSYADLRSADLRYANLSYAKGVFPALNNSALQLLSSQKNKLIAYKYLTMNMQSPTNSDKITYVIGKQVIEKNFNTDIFENCGAGINLATLEWCIRITNLDIKNYKFVEFEFMPKDIVCLPFNSDGKFRVKKCKPIRILKLKELQKYLEEIK